MKKRIYTLLITFTLLFTAFSPYAGALNGSSGTADAAVGAAATGAKLIAFTFDDGPSA